MFSFITIDSSVCLLSYYYIYIFLHLSIKYWDIINKLKKEDCKYIKCNIEQ